MADLISQRTALAQENTQLQQEAGAIEQQRLVLAAQKASIEAQNALIAQRAADAQKAQAQLAVIQRMGGNVALYEPGVRLSESKLQEATQGQGEAVLQYNLAGQQLNTRIEMYNSKLAEYGSAVEGYNKQQEAFGGYLQSVAEGGDFPQTVRLRQGISGGVLRTGGRSEVSGKYSESEFSLYKGGGQYEERPDVVQSLKEQQLAGSMRYLGVGADDIVYLNNELFKESSLNPEQIAIANQVFSGRMSALAAYERERELEQDRLKTGMLIGGTATFIQPASYIEAYKAIIGNTPAVAQVNATPYVQSEEQLRARAIILSSPTAQFGSPDIYASEYAKIKERTAYPIEATGIKKIDFAPAIEKDETGQIRFYGVEGSPGVQISKQANEARLATINAASVMVAPTPVPPDTARLPGWGVMTPQTYAEKYNLPYTFQGTEQQKQQYAEKWWGELPASQKIKIGVTTVASNFFSRPVNVILTGGDFSKVKLFETLAYETVAGEGAAYREAGDSYWGGLGKSLMANELLITGITAYGFGAGIGLVSRIPTVGAPIATATGIGAASYGVGDIGYKAYTGDVRGAMIEGTAFIASAPLAMAGFKGVGGKAVSISALVPKIEMPKISANRIIESGMEPLGKIADVISVRSETGRKLFGLSEGYILKSEAVVVDARPIMQRMFGGGAEGTKWWQQPTPEYTQAQFKLYNPLESPLGRTLKPAPIETIDFTSKLTSQEKALGTFDITNRIKSFFELTKVELYPKKAKQPEVIDVRPLSEKMFGRAKTEAKPQWWREPTPEYIQSEFKKYNPLTAEGRVLTKPQTEVIDFTPQLSLRERMMGTFSLRGYLKGRTGIELYPKKAKQPEVIDVRPLSEKMFGKTVQPEKADWWKIPTKEYLKAEFEKLNPFSGGDVSLIEKVKVAKKPLINIRFIASEEAVPTRTVKDRFKVDRELKTRWNIREKEFDKQAQGGSFAVTKEGLVVLTKQKPPEVMTKTKSPIITIVPPNNILLKTNKEMLKRVSVTEPQKTTSRFKVLTKPSVMFATKERQGERQRQQQFNTAMLRTDTRQAYKGAQKYQSSQLSRLQPLEKLAPVEATVGMQRTRTMQKTSPALKAMQESVSKLKSSAFASSKRKVKAGRGFYAYKEHAKIATPSQILQGMMK